MILEGFSNLNNSKIHLSVLLDTQKVSAWHLRTICLSRGLGDPKTSLQGCRQNSCYSLSKRLGMFSLTAQKRTAGDLSLCLYLEFKAEGRNWGKKRCRIGMEKSWTWAGIIPDPLELDYYSLIICVNHNIILLPGLWALIRDEDVNWKRWNKGIFFWLWKFTCPGNNGMSHQTPTLVPVISSRLIRTFPPRALPGISFWSLIEKALDDWILHG